MHMGTSLSLSFSLSLFPCTPVQTAGARTRQPAVCLQFGCQLSFTLDDPHDGLDHLQSGALAADISCVQLQEKEN